MKWDWLLFSGLYFLLALVLVLLAGWLFGLATPLKVRQHLGERDNAAVGLALMGYLAGVIAVIAGTFAGGGEETATWTTLAREMPTVVLYALLGMGALLLAGIINDLLILPQFSINQAVVEQGNVGVAAVLAGSYLGSGLVIAGGIHGSVDLTSLGVGFVLGQAGLVLFSWVYCRISAHDEAAELGERGNVAVGVAWGGHLVAYGVLLKTGLAVSVHALTWEGRLIHLAYYAGVGLVLLPLARLLGNRLLIPGHRLFEEIVRDRNLGAAFLEGGMAVCMAVILVTCF